MLIRIEPKDLFMFAVYFLFNKERPDPEDEEVKAYLQGHQLIPKRELDTEWHGTSCHTMYFGGCYIQDHLRAIEALHQKGAEKLMLTWEIEQVLAQESPKEVQQITSTLSPEQQQEVKAGLLERFHVASSFKVDEEGYWSVAIPAAEIHQEFLRAASTARVRAAE